MRLTWSNWFGTKFAPATVLRLALAIVLAGSIFHSQATASENSNAVSKTNQLQGCWRAPGKVGTGDVFVELCFQADMNFDVTYLSREDGAQEVGSYSVGGDTIYLLQDTGETQCVFEASRNSLWMRNCDHEGDYKKFNTLDRRLIED